LMKNIVEQYLLLIKANETDLDNNLEKYIRIFEPMIELLEKGIDFTYRGANNLDIPSLGCFMLKGIKWYEFYYNRLQKEIAEGRLKLEDVDC